MRFRPSLMSGLTTIVVRLGLSAIITMPNTYIIYILFVSHYLTVIYDYKCYKIENDNISIQNLSDLDSTDKNVILLITKGYTSSYAIWAFMKNEAKTLTHPKRVMTYKNINTRVVKLFNAGLLKEVELTGRPPHGRIEYKVNIQGLEELIPDIMVHPDELDNVVQYIDKTGLDKIIFQDLLIERVISTLEALDKCLNTAVAPLTDSQSEKLIKSLTEIQQQIDKLDKTLGYGPERFKFKTASKSLETTTNSLEVAKDIRKVIEEHNKKYTDV